MSNVVKVYIGVFLNIYDCYGHRYKTVFQIFKNQKLKNIMRNKLCFKDSHSFLVNFSKES